MSLWFRLVADGIYPARIHFLFLADAFSPPDTANTSTLYYLSAGSRSDLIPGSFQALRTCGTEQNI